MKDLPEYDSPELMSWFKEILIPEEQMAIRIKRIEDQEIWKDIVSELLDQAFLNNHEEFKEKIVDEEDGSITIIDWKIIRLLIIILYHNMATWSESEGKDFHVFEDILREVVFESLQIGMPYSGVVYRNESSRMILHGPYIPPCKKIIENPCPSICIMIEKDGIWSSYSEYGDEYYDYIWRPEIWIDDDIIDALEIKAGDKINSRIFLQPLIESKKFLYKPDKGVYKIE